VRGDGGDRGERAGERQAGGGGATGRARRPGFRAKEGEAPGAAKRERRPKGGPGAACKAREEGAKAEG